MRWIIYRRAGLQSMSAVTAAAMAVVLGFLMIPVRRQLVQRAVSLEKGYQMSGIYCDAVEKREQDVLRGGWAAEPTGTQSQAAAGALDAPLQNAGSSILPAVEPQTEALTVEPPRQSADEVKTAENADLVDKAGQASKAAAPVQAASEGTLPEQAPAVPQEAPAAYEQEIDALIQSLYEIKARAESSLDECIKEAKAEYRALPAAQRTQARKLAICFSKAGMLSELKASCDQEVGRIIDEMRRILIENGQSTALAEQAQATYEREKSTTYASLIKRLYKTKE